VPSEALRMLSPIFGVQMAALPLSLHYFDWHYIDYIFFSFSFIAADDSRHYDYYYDTVFITLLSYAFASVASFHNSCLLRCIVSFPITPAISRQYWYRLRLRHSWLHFTLTEASRRW
jgi:hypothetical protein